MENCANCNAAYAEGLNVCPDCGWTKNNRNPDIQANAWRARGDEFAARINLKATGGNVMSVDPGSRALIWRDDMPGTAPLEYGPGSYEFDTFFKRLNRFFKTLDVNALVTREGPLPIRVKVDKGIESKEGLDIDVDLEIGIKIIDPRLFAANMMGNTEVFTAEKMQACLQSGITQFLKEYFLNKSLTELNRNPNTRPDLDYWLDKSCNNLLNKYGLAFCGVTSLSVGHTAFDEHKQIRAQAWLEIDKRIAELEKRESLDQIYNKEQLQDLNRARIDLTIKQDKQALTNQDTEDEYQQRLFDLEQLKKISEADSEEAAVKQGLEQALEELKHKATKSGLDRDEEQISWRHLRELARFEREQEIQQISAEQQHNQEMERLDYEEKEEKRRYQIEIALEKQKVKDEIELAELVDSEDNRLLKSELEKQETEEGQRRKQELQDEALAVNLFNLRQQKQQARFEFEKQQHGWKQKQSQERQRWEQDLRIEKAKSEFEIDRLRHEMEDGSRINQMQHLKDLRELELKHQLDQKRLDNEKEKIQAEVEIARFSAQRDVGVAEAEANATAAAANSAAVEREHQINDLKAQRDKDADRDERIRDKEADRALEMARILSGNLNNGGNNEKNGNGPSTVINNNYGPGHGNNRKK